MLPPLKVTVSKCRWNISVSIVRILVSGSGLYLSNSCQWLMLLIACNIARFCALMIVQSQLQDKSWHFLFNQPTFLEFQICLCPVSKRFPKGSHFSVSGADFYRPHAIVCHQTDIKALKASHRHRSQCNIGAVETTVGKEQKNSFNCVVVDSLCC